MYIRETRNNTMKKEKQHDIERDKAQRTTRNSTKPKTRKNTSSTRKNTRQKTVPARLAAGFGLLLPGGGLRAGKRPENGTKNEKKHKVCFLRGLC